jgi:hypothetical protein
LNVRLGAFEHPAWIPRRPGAAVAALALNAGLGAALILSFRTPIVLESRDVDSTLIWLPETVSRPKPAETRHSDTQRSRANHARASAETLSPITPSVAPISTTPSRAPVDWWNEAERVVKERTHAAPTLPDSGRIDLHIGSRADAPAHYAGESYQDESGAKIVWVSDKCYIESDPPLPGTPTAFEHARLTRTYCPGNYNAPRGDLFKDLPAYQKYQRGVP